jgi:hypothetical protein
VEAKPVVGATKAMNEPIIRSGEKFAPKVGIKESPISIAVMIAGKTTIRIEET